MFLGRSGPGQPRARSRSGGRTNRSRNSFSNGRCWTEKRPRHTSSRIWNRIRPAKRRRFAQNGLRQFKGGAVYEIKGFADTVFGREIAPPRSRY